MITRFHSELAVALLLCGCSTWGNTLTVEGLPADPPPGRQFQIWRNDTAHVLHAVRSSGDTISGILTGYPARCDSCRVRIARADVDSVRTMEFQEGDTALATGLGLGVLTITGILGLIALRFLFAL